VKPERRRKRRGHEEDAEDRYMQQLVKEGEREEEKRQTERQLKRRKLDQSGGSGTSSEHQEASNQENISDADELEEKERVPPSDVPLHESLAPGKDTVELEKASRTVFLANVSTLTISSKSAKKTLLAHLASFFPAIPEATEGKPAHKVESIRFRSTAYAGTSLPKKAAFVKRELMPATTQSTNAYAVYSTAFAAREAVRRLNGTMVLDRHLRVDGVAHPAKVDHRRCVFVGNLGFVDDESMLPQGDENERKRSKIPSDVEEGLWRQFGKAGKVESVRVIRDERTRVGKGFAYVQFEVSSLLLYH
jgi:nucleolar protein 12